MLALELFVSVGGIIFVPGVLAASSMAASSSSSSSGRQRSRPAAFSLGLLGPGAFVEDRL